MADPAMLHKKLNSKVITAALSCIRFDVRLIIVQPTCIVKSFATTRHGTHAPTWLTSYRFVGSSSMNGILVIYFLI